MFYTEQGLKHQFLSALNRWAAISFSPALQGQRSRPGTENRPGAEIIFKTPKILAREKHLAIPTFIRQGKTLGL